MRRLPNGIPATHCRLSEFLRIAGISKNTFFLRYRSNPNYECTLDIREDRMHRLYLAIAAAEQIAQERKHKPAHGNKGRAPRRPCGVCSIDMHPRHRQCPACGWSPPPHQD